jgi:hypothetical protein
MATAIETKTLLTIFQQFTVKLAQKYADPGLHQAILSSYESVFSQESNNLNIKRKLMDRRINWKLVSSGVYFFRPPQLKATQITQVFILAGLAYFLMLCKRQTSELLNALNQQVQNKELPLFYKDSMAHIHFFSILKKVEKMKNGKRFGDILPEIAQSVFGDELFHASLVLLAASFLLIETNKAGCLEERETIRELVEQVQKELSKTKGDEKSKNMNFREESVRMAMRFLGQKMPMGMRILGEGERLPKEVEGCLAFLVKKGEGLSFGLMLDANKEFGEPSGIPGEISDIIDTGKSRKHQSNEDISTSAGWQPSEGFSFKASIDEKCMVPPAASSQRGNIGTEISSFMNRVPLRRAMSKENCPNGGEKPSGKGVSHYAQICLALKEEEEESDYRNQKKCFNILCIERVERKRNKFRAWYLCKRKS